MFKNQKLVNKEKSLLSQWETMHRPPGSESPPASFPLPPVDQDKERRCSVISCNQTKPVMHFPVKNKKIVREKKLSDIRRPSDLWQVATPDSPDCCSFILTLLSYLLIMVTLPISLCMCIKVRK